MCEDEYVRAWVSERVCKRQRVCEGKCDGVECVGGETKSCVSLNLALNGRLPFMYNED